MNRAFDFDNASIAFTSKGREVTSRQVSVRLSLVTILGVSQPCFFLTKRGRVWVPTAQLKCLQIVEVIETWNLDQNLLTVNRLTLTRNVVGSPRSLPGPWAAGGWVEGVCSDH